MANLCYDTKSSSPSGHPHVVIEKL